MYKNTLKLLFLSILISFSVYAQKEYVISRNNKLTLIKCKKAKSKDHDEKFKNKSLCLKVLKDRCNSGFYGGTSMKGDKCKSVKKFILKENKFGTSLKCKKAKWNSIGDMFTSKKECIVELKKKCGEGGYKLFKMKGSKCKKIKRFVLNYDNPHNYKCRKVDAWNNGDDRFDSMNDCIKDLKKVCDSKKFFKFKGKSCRRVKTYAIEEDFKRSTLKCNKADKIEIHIKELFLSKEKCLEKLKKQCLEKESVGYRFVKEKCITF